MWKQQQKYYNSWLLSLSQGLAKLLVILKLDRLVELAQLSFYKYNNIEHLGINNKNFSKAKSKLPIT